MAVGANLWTHVRRQARFQLLHLRRRGTRKGKTYRATDGRTVGSQRCRRPLQANSFRYDVREMSWFLPVFSFYLGCVLVAAIRILDRRRGRGWDTGGYDPEFGFPPFHEHYHSFLYLCILAAVLHFPPLYFLGAPLLLDEAYIHRPHEFAWGYPWFWKSTAWGLFLMIIWVDLEILL